MISTTEMSRGEQNAYYRVRNAIPRASSDVAMLVTETLGDQIFEMSFAEIRETARTISLAP